MIRLTKTERLEEKLSKGEVLIGTHLSLPEPMIPEMIGLAGFDILWIDAEHSCLDKRDLALLIMAANQTDMAVFVRVPCIDASFVKPLLDVGADGIIFPNIRSVEDARHAVEATQYPPCGIRGYGPGRVMTLYGVQGEQDYIHRISKKVWTIIQIEHYDTVDHLEEIMEVPGINMLCAGPCDLSGSLGKLALVDDPECRHWYDLLVEKANKRGMPIGVSCGDSAAADWLRRGVNWINVGGDNGYIISGAINMFNEMKALVSGIRG